jgi:hypothetical protein
MRTWRTACVGLCSTITTTLIGPIAANAAEPRNGTLTCDSQSIPVLIHGAGVAFGVTTDTSNYVVTFAQRDDGLVVVDSQGSQQNEVECMLSSPELAHTYLLNGFFTPRS